MEEGLDSSRSSQWEENTQICRVKQGQIVRTLACSHLRVRRTTSDHSKARTSHLEVIIGHGAMTIAVVGAMVEVVISYGMRSNEQLGCAIAN